MCQPDILTKSSCGLKFGDSTAVNVWASIGENTLSTILHNVWERGRVTLILLTHLAGDVN